jgi:hypothetical protein
MARRTQTLDASIPRDRSISGVAGLRVVNRVPRETSLKGITKRKGEPAPVDRRWEAEDRQAGIYAGAMLCAHHSPSPCVPHLQRPSTQAHPPEYCRQ